MNDSKLSVEVVEAEDLRTTQSAGGSPIEPYILINIEGQQAETQEAKTTKNPQWGEIFTFDITTGQEELMVYLANKDIYGGHDVLGQCSIDMFTFRDQMRHDLWFELEAPQNDFVRVSQLSNAMMGRVHLVVKWIFCRQKYLETGLKRLDEALIEE
jgi:Ca2+-dependent lipid-binding protein